MDQTSIFKRVTEYFKENENEDEYLDEISGMVFYQDYVNGICVKTGNDYQDDDHYFIFYEEINE